MSWGLFRSMTCSNRVVREHGKRSSITTLRKQPLKYSLKIYFPLAESKGTCLLWSYGNNIEHRSFDKLLGWRVNDVLRGIPSSALVRPLLPEHRDSRQPSSR